MPNLSPPSAPSTPSLAPPVLRRLRRKCEETLCRESLHWFIRRAWPILEPGNPLEDNWHVGAIAAHLEALTRGDIFRLLITIPPGLGKSIFTAAMWPAWEWAANPTIRSQFGSYDDQLVMRDSVRCRDVIGSRWYQDTFRPKWTFKADQNTKHDFQNTARGFRRAFAIGGKVTGHRGDKVVLDDPLNARDRYNARVKAGVMDLFDNVLSTRVNDPRKARFLIIMQRLAHDDPVGVLKERGGWEELSLPAEHDPARCCVSVIKWQDADTGARHEGWSDPRTEELELLFPERYTRDVLDNFAAQLGTSEYESQFNQNPSPPGGGAFKTRWFRRWRFVAGSGQQLVELTRWPIDRHTGQIGPEEREVLPVSVCRSFGVTDPACGLEAQNDPTGIGVFLVTPKKDLVWYDYTADRIDEPESIQLHREIYAHYREPPLRLGYFVVEENSIGMPLVQNLRQAPGGGLPIKTIWADRDKLAMSVTARVRAEAGQVFLPYEAEWLPLVEKELGRFPGDDHDESVTVLSLAAIEVFGDGPMDLAGIASRPAPQSNLYDARGMAGMEVVARAKPPSPREDGSIEGATAATQAHRRQSPGSRSRPLYGRGRDDDGNGPLFGR